MSRTKKRKPAPGKEFWGKRPVSRNHGAVPGKISKKRTHKVERLEGKKQIEMDFEHYWLCSECAKERGGTFPEGHCCTVMADKCPYCNETKTVIPYVDFNWPTRKTAHLRD